MIERRKRRTDLLANSASTKREASGQQTLSSVHAVEKQQKGVVKLDVLFMLVVFIAFIVLFYDNHGTR